MKINNIELKKQCRELAKRIEKKWNKYDLILTVTKGWLIPTYYIADYLWIKYIEVLNINTYEDNERWEIKDLTLFSKDFSKKSVLLIDDLVDTWYTIDIIKKKYDFKELDIATLYHKEWSIIYPDICYMYNINEWERIEFEYET